MFGIEGSVFVIKTDSNYHLHSCSILDSSLEFEPSLVAHFCETDPFNNKIVASSAGYVSILDFGSEPPKI